MIRNKCYNKKNECFIMTETATDIIATQSLLKDFLDNVQKVPNLKKNMKTSRNITLCFWVQKKYIIL